MEPASAPPGAEPAPSPRGNRAGLHGTDVDDDMLGRGGLRGGGNEPGSPEREEPRRRLAEDIVGPPTEPDELLKYIFSKRRTLADAASVITRPSSLRFVLLSPDGSDRLRHYLRPAMSFLERQ